MIINKHSCKFVIVDCHPFLTLSHFPTISDKVSNIQSKFKSLQMIKNHTDFLFVLSLFACVSSIAAFASSYFVSVCVFVIAFHPPVRLLTKGKEGNREKNAPSNGREFPRSDAFESNDVSRGRHLVFFFVELSRRREIFTLFVCWKNRYRPLAHSLAVESCSELGSLRMINAKQK